MNVGSYRTSTVIAAVLILIALLVFLGGFIPFMDCPYRAWEKDKHTDTMGPYGCVNVCKNGRVSFIYWWRHRRALEGQRSVVPWRFFRQIPLFTDVTPRTECLT